MYRTVILPAIKCWYEMWFLILGKNINWGCFRTENIWTSQRGSNRRTEFHNLYSSPNIIR